MKKRNRMAFANNWFKHLSEAEKDAMVLRLWEMDLSLIGIALNKKNKWASVKWD